MLYPDSISAQDANKVMHTACTKFKNYNSVESNYTIVFTEGSNKKSAIGGIIMQKNKYVNLVNGTKTWFDGKTMWTYVKDNEEVTITEPNNNDLFTNNPYFFINSYNKEFNASFQGYSNDFYNIKLIPKNSTNDIKYVLLKLFKNSYHPHSILIFMQNSQIEIKLNTFVTNNKYKNSSFTFDKKKYPGIEIIDLR